MHSQLRLRRAVFSCRMSGRHVLFATQVLACLHTLLTDDALPAAHGLTHPQMCRSPKSRHKCHASLEGRHKPKSQTSYLSASWKVWFWTRCFITHHIGGLPLRLSYQLETRPALTYGSVFTNSSMSCVRNSASDCVGQCIRRSVNVPERQLRWHPER